MKRWVVAGALLLAVACEPVSAPNAPGSGSPALTGVVTWVNDGDSIEVEVGDDLLEVRLAGVNAPERDECFYEPARDHLIDTLKNRTVVLDTLDEDQFGRILAYVSSEDREINFELVELGLAIASSSDNGGQRSADLLAAEETAFAAGVGMWSDDACGEGIASSIDVVIDATGSVVDPPGPDEQVLSAERIVVVNKGTGSVDIGGWMLRDESSRNRYVFASDVVLDSGESFVVASDSGWSPGGTPVWNNGGDMALLQDPNGVVVSRWRY